MNNIDTRPSVYIKEPNGRYKAVGSMNNPYVWDGWHSEGFWYNYSDDMGQGAMLIVKKENMKAPAMDYANACLLIPEIEAILRTSESLSGYALAIARLIAEK